MDVPAALKPSILDLLSCGKCSPIRVFTIGMIIVTAIPFSEYRTSIEVKSHAAKHPTAETTWSPSPASRSVLDLTLTLTAPGRRAVKNPTTEDRVRI